MMLTPYFSIFLLRSLDLSHNQLTDIEEGSFQSLPSLQILKIQNNRIAALGK
jgi:Leucine-rich repeat (LRR) protein